MTRLEQIFIAEYGATKNLTSALHAVATAVLANEHQRHERRTREITTKIMASRATGPLTRKTLTDEQIAQVIAACAAAYSVPAERVPATSPYPSRAVIYARSAAVGVMRKFDMSFPAIRRALRMKCHRSAIDARDRCAANPDLAAVVDDVYRRLKAMEAT